MVMDAKSREKHGPRYMYKEGAISRLSLTKIVMFVEQGDFRPPKKGRFLHKKGDFNLFQETWKR